MQPPVKHNQVHFDSSQQTTPKILKANGYQTALVGKWHLESNPTGFDYWEILPGQGHYYQPEFITAHGQHTKQGYITDIITDKSIKWLSNRDKTKPFALFVHHKATHRNWMPKIEDLQAYEKQTFTIPAIFFDTYDGGLAASTAEMCIDKHMHWGYDLKASDPVSGKNYITDAINSSDKKKHCRTNAAARTKSRTAILRFHSKRLSKPPFKRSRTCRMEVSALYERLFENSQSARRQHRAIVFVPRKKMIGSKIR